MSFNDLFEQRCLVGKKLKDILRDCGFSKVSFSKKTDISRPTLDKILNGDIDNKSTFDKHLHKILSALNMTVDELLLFNTPAKTVDAVYSENAPSDYDMSDKAKKQYDLLMDILNLCSIYY